MDFAPHFLPKSFKIIAEILLHAICYYTIVEIPLPMKELKKMKTEELIDMLTDLTARYTDKMAKMNSVELSQYEYDIALIQGELNSRINKEIPLSDTQRIFNGIKSMLPLWRRYLLSSRTRRKPGFS